MRLQPSIGAITRKLLTLKSALFFDFPLNAGDFVRDFVDPFLDRLDVGMHLGENCMLLFRNFFDPLRLFSQLIKNGILSGGDSVHPPEPYQQPMLESPGSRKVNDIKLAT